MKTFALIALISAAQALRIRAKQPNQDMVKDTTAAGTTTADMTASGMTAAEIAA